MKNLFYLFAALLFSQTTVAQTKTWNGTESTAWNAANNWSPAGEPAATNIVVLPAATANQPTISTAAVAKSVEVQAGATLTNAVTGSLTINSSNFYSGLGTCGFYNAGTVQNNGQLVLGNTAAVGNYGLYNLAVFNNNTGAEIRIDRAGSIGLYNSTGGTFTNASGITIGAVANGATGIFNNATFNTTGCGKTIVVRGSIQNYVSVTNAGLMQVAGELRNSGTFTNQSVLKYGTLTGTVTNSANSAVIVNNTPTPIFTYGGAFTGTVNGIFTDAAATVSAGTFAAPNSFTPSGLSGGTQTLYAKIIPSGGACSYIVPFTYLVAPISWTGAVSTDWGNAANWSPATVPTAQDDVVIPAAPVNRPTISTAAFAQSVEVQAGAVLTNAASGSLTINGSRTQTISGSSRTVGLYSPGIIHNNGRIAIGNVGTIRDYGLWTSADFNNNAGSELTIDNSNYIDLNTTGGVFTNAATIRIGLTASVTNTGIKNQAIFTNNVCGKIIIKGNLQNDASKTFTNAGLVQTTAYVNNGTFTNQGVLKYGSFFGSVTNTANSAVIVNDTPTPIFTYGGTYDGIVNGIFTDAAATVSAGTFAAPNTFMASGLAGGTQTLYAKITPSGGACSYIVPFTYVSPGFTAQPISQLLCPGSVAAFTVAVTNATSYQWQLNNGSGWTNIPATAPYSNVTTTALAISNVNGLSGNQYRCVATGPGGSTNSNAATLTLSATAVSTPTGTITWTGTVGTDWNAFCNWSPTGVPTAGNDVVIPAAPVNQPTISTAAVAKSVEVQAGATLTTAATGSLTINDSKSYLISSSTYTIGFYNAGTVHHNGQLILGNTAAIGQYGLFNTATFNNNADAEISIDRSTYTGLHNTLGATFNNAADIVLGAAVSTGFNGLNNIGTFNHTGGEIRIDRTTQAGLSNSYSGGTFTNSAKIIIGANANVGLYGLDNTKNFTNAAGGEIIIDRSTTNALKNDYSTVFTNAGKITIGATANVGNFGIGNQGVFNHNAGGELTIDQATVGGINNGFGTFTNGAVITIGATNSVGTYGINNTGGTFNNSNCGKVIVANGNLRNNSAFTNAGLFQLADSLKNTNTFTNQGVLKYGTLTGSVTNTANSAVIVNDTPTPIFTYGGTYDGVVNGIFTDAAATVSAGIFSAPNAFTPAPALPSGSQTLYAKLTPAGGACSYAVPFMYVNPAAVVDYTISTAGGTIIITDVSGAGETLSVSESGSNIRFVVAGKTYSLNGGGITSFSITPATIGIAGKTGIVLNAGGGDDVIQVGAFMTVFPSLTINGGTGNDQVFMNGSITFAPGAILDMDLHDDEVVPGLDSVTISTGANLILSAATMGRAVIMVK